MGVKRFLASDCCMFMRKRQPQQSIEGLEEAKGVKFYSYKELRSATNNFHPDNKIGVGGFGSVYKGALKDGTLVAVKQLSAESTQGVREFVTEISLISRIKHNNLVELLGCCVDQNQRILVYGYMENNSLSQALLGSDIDAIELDWPARAKICTGTASGLAYLHDIVDPYIVHRDIKASNLLLDKDLTPKISDFGLAKLFPDNVSHISTRVAGTIGYLAPEYAMRGKLTKKADIYSFGVLLLEVISGRNNTNSSLPSEEQFLLEMAWQLHEEERMLELVDPRLEGQYPKEEVLRFIEVALLCTQATANYRPTMTQVVEMLTSGIPTSRRKPSRPGFISDLTKLKKKVDDQRKLSIPNMSSTTAGSSSLFTNSQTSSEGDLQHQC